MRRTRKRPEENDLSVVSLLLLANIGVEGGHDRPLQTLATRMGRAQALPRPLAG